MKPFIEFKNVTKEYLNGETKLKAVNNLNFTIDKGEFIVILGPSGSGKSTLLNLLGGLDSTTTGNIIFDNNDITKYNDNQLTEYRAEKIGFIFQFYNLIPNLTALENIELIEDVINKEINAEEALNQVNLSNHYHHFPSELSGGEQQRVSIARAIVKKPEMLLCDEPTGALDTDTGNMIIKLLYDLCKKNKTTIVVVTHNEDIALIADKIIYLRNGKIEEIETKPPANIDNLIGDENVIQENDKRFIRP